MSTLVYTHTGVVVVEDVEVREAKLAYWLLAMHESIAWYEQAVLRGVSLVKDEGFWRMVVKASRSKRAGEQEFLVSFYSGHTPLECIESFATAVSKRTVVWHADRFPPT